MAGLMRLYAKLKLRVNADEECGGAGVGSIVSGLQLLGGPGKDRETSRGAESP